MNEILNFLSELRENNNREWFAANKDRYTSVKQKVDTLTRRLIDIMAAIDPETLRLSVADCTYRIYRDTRFSPDKTPYKTHIGIFINPPYGKKSMRCGYYLHLEPDNCFIAAGTVCLPSTTVKAIRQSIYDEIDEYRSIVEAPEFTSIFSEIGMNPLKTAPKGFPREWPYISYLRPRDFCCSGKVSNDILFDPHLPELLLPAWTQAKRYNDFINYTIDELSVRDA